ncbi:MAG: hypothetical protein PHH13_01850 [Candidatus Peribacteraceae bacterium]|nr:hypothetical protein [Candidatus Peribacteraceae bacterium]
MHPSSFQLRHSDKPVLWRVLAIVVVGVLVNSYLHICETTCWLFVWGSFAIVWLPVLLGYLVTYGKEVRVTTLQRCMAHILVIVFTIILNDIFGPPDPADELILYYLFLLLPAQLILILFIELMLKVVGNRGNFPKMDKKRLLVTIGTIIVAIGVVFSSIILYEDFGSDVVTLSGAFVWFPIMMNYLFFFLIRKHDNSFTIETMERIFTMFFATLVSLGFLSFVQNADSRSYLTVAYLCLSFLAQLVMILIIESLLSLAKKGEGDLAH